MFLIIAGFHISILRVQVLGPNVSFPHFHLFFNHFEILYCEAPAPAINPILYFKKSATWFFLLSPPGEQHATYTPSAGSSYSLLNRLLSLMDLTSLAALQIYCDMCICMYSAGLLVSAFSLNVNCLWHFAADFNPISDSIEPIGPTLFWWQISQKNLHVKLRQNTYLCTILLGILFTSGNLHTRKFCVPKVLGQWALQSLMP